MCFSCLHFPLPKNMVNPDLSFLIRLQSNCQARDLVVEEKEHFKRYKQDQVKDLWCCVLFLFEVFFQPR